MLFYKFRRLMIGQNCSAVCTNMAHSRANRAKCHALKPQAKRQARSVLGYSLMVVDLTFKQSENVIAW